MFPISPAKVAALPSSSFPRRSPPLQHLEMVGRQAHVGRVAGGGAEGPDHRQDLAVVDRVGIAELQLGVLVVAEAVHRALQAMLAVEVEHRLHGVQRAGRRIGLGPLLLHRSHQTVEVTLQPLLVLAGALVVSGFRIRLGRPLAIRVPDAEDGERELGAPSLAGLLVLRLRVAHEDDEIVRLFPEADPGDLRRHRLGGDPIR
ncbi:hypothetical protein [Vulgatibacter sp.]|uniref:hypothetical protein n=1 Tax=Vulgatibacter sp. TaxID=1971226 RepID=UPI0035615ED1